MHLVRRTYTHEFFEKKTTVSREKRWSSKASTLQTVRRVADDYTNNKLHQITKI